MVANREETRDVTTVNTVSKRIGKKQPQLRISCLKAQVFHIWIHWMFQFRSK